MLQFFPCSSDKYIYNDNYGGGNNGHLDSVGL